MQRIKLHSDVYPLPYSSNSDLLHSMPVQVLENPTVLRPLPLIPLPLPYVSPPGDVIGSHSPRTSAFKQINQQSEPLDLSSKAGVSQISSHGGSKLEQLLTNKPSTAVRRKRPYSCFSKEARNTVTKYQRVPAITDMEDAADNPVVMVELASGYDTAVNEQISCSLIKV